MYSHLDYKPQHPNNKLMLWDVILSVYPHREALKNMPGHGGIRTYDLWNTSPMLCQLSWITYSNRPEYRQGRMNRVGGSRQSRNTVSTDLFIVFS